MHDEKVFLFENIVGAEYIVCTHCTHGSYAYVVKWSRYRLNSQKLVS